MVFYCCQAKAYHFLQQYRFNTVNGKKSCLTTESDTKILQSIYFAYNMRNSEKCVQFIYRVYFA